ncbi:MAG: sporulation integral membrane protein YtvI [Roseburia sp.]|nr:sporulation integral membrane protein YtvI [Roseburia sp.]
MEEKGAGNGNLKLIVNLIISLVILLLCIFLVPRLILFFMPFIIGGIISCIANPLVLFLERKLKVRRKAGTVVVIVLTIAAVSGLLYLAISILFRQMMGFIVDAPEMWASMTRDLDKFGTFVNQHIGNFAPKLNEAITNIGNILGETISSLPGKLDFESFEGMGSMVGSIANGIISVIMCMLSAYFFIADREWLSRFADRFISEGVRRRYEVLYRSLKQAVGGYFKAQLRIEIWMYLLILVGISILKVRYALLIALLMAFLDFLPFFGTGAVLVPWAIITAFGGNYVRAIGFLVIWGVGQLVRQLIQPKIMGDSIGMEPIPTLFLLFVGYRLAGVAGMLIAVPLGIILVNMNEAGFFDTPKYSLEILIARLNRYRRLDEEDMRALEQKRREEDR